MEKWNELTICNDFIFGKVMRNTELCKELLEIILNIPIDRVEFPEEQKTIDISGDGRGVRLDVYVKDGKNTVYDIEMQTAQKEGLAKRTRYYQGMIDLALLEKGAKFKDLNKSYIIFICTFDAFKKGRSVYTFENTCREVKSLLLGDETQKISLNAKGANESSSPKLRAFLQYIAGNESDDAFVRKLDAAVQKAKSNKEWRREYMLLAMRDRENVDKGIQIEERRIVFRMHERGMSKSLIAEMTGISEEKVDEILGGTLVSE